MSQKLKNPERQYKKNNIFFRVADPDPGSGMGKQPGSGSGMNNLDHISESLEIIFWVKIHKFFDSDPDSGMEKFGSRINISDPQH
jgi:hypothetical protein